MPEIIINQAYSWMSNDDFLKSKAQYIYWEWVDPTFDWYWFTLANKVEKWVLTAWVDMNWFISSFNNINVWAFWPSRIYDAKWWDWDNTPKYTYTLSQNLIQWVEHNWYFYFLSENATVSRILISDANAWNWAWNVDESYKTFTKTWTSKPVMFSYRDTFLYVWFWPTIIRIDNAWVETQSDIFQSDVIWISNIWGNFKIYSTRWQVQFWDWVSAALSDFTSKEINPIQVIKNWTIDHIITLNYDYYQMAWYDIREITVQKESKRLLDNTSVREKFWFVALWIWLLKSSVYLLGNVDTDRWLYKYAKIKWLPMWFNRVIAKDYEWNVITNFFWIYGQKTQNRLYFSYSTALTRWIWFMREVTFSKTDEWYYLSNIFNVWPKGRFKFEEFRAMASNCWPNKWVEIKIRRNNLPTTAIDSENFESLINISDETDDTITQKKNTSFSWKCIDFQILIILTNDTAAPSDAPILHSLYIDYKITDD